MVRGNKSVGISHFIALVSILMTHGDKLPERGYLIEWMVRCVAFEVDTVPRIWTFAVACQYDCQRKQCKEKFLHCQLNIAKKLFKFS